MVDAGTWSKLSPAEQGEFLSYQAQFIKAVQSSGASDGWTFGQDYQVTEKNGQYFLSAVGSNLPFAGIFSPNKSVIEALRADAVQNYGR